MTDLTLTNLNQTLAEFHISLKGIEAEIRLMQYFKGPVFALRWWKNNFAHKYPLYRYDTVEQRIIERK